jgi:glucuronate isomerase
VDKLSTVSGVPIDDYDDLLAALRARHDFFHQAGCRLSDHGLERPYAAEFTPAIVRIFAKVRRNESLTRLENDQFKTAVLLELARMDADRAGPSSFTSGPCAIPIPGPSANWAPTPATIPSATGEMAGPWRAFSTGWPAKTT